MNPGGGTARHEAGQSGGMVYRLLRRTILAEKRKPLFEDAAFRDHFTLASLCAMISGAVKVTPQGRNWFGAKKLALKFDQ
jgi:hypothetical protein